MNSVLRLSLFLVIFAGAACSHDTVSQAPRNYKAASTEVQRRPNDRSHFKKAHSPGFGIDLNAKNPYRTGTVNAPKRYKFTNNPK